MNNNMQCNTDPDRLWRLAEEEEIDTEAMKTVGKNKTAMLSLTEC